MYLYDYVLIVSKIPTHVEIFVDMASVVVPQSVYEYTLLIANSSTTIV